MDLMFMLVLGVLVLVGLIVLGIAVYVRKKRTEENQEPDYRAFFILGICFLPLGAVWLSIESLRPVSFAYLGMGIVFLSIGLSNRDKWKKTA